MTWQTTQAEWRVSSTELYVVERAHGGDDAWAATYQGPVISVDVDARGDHGEHEWWSSIADARMACALHRRRMERGDSAEKAAVYVQQHAAKDLEIELGLYEPQAAEE